MKNSGIFKCKRGYFIPIFKAWNVFKAKSTIFGKIDCHDWMGSDFLPFVKARTFTRRLQLKNRKEYAAWLSSGRRAKFIPALPKK